MNEQVARIGGQIRQAFGRLRDVWKRQEAARRKHILIAAIGIVVFAILLMIILSAVNGRYVVLYDSMSEQESITGVGVLDTAGIPARVRNGKLEVPSRQSAAAMAQLALEGIPAVTLDYNVIAQASGLTTTEFEKNTYLWLQWQDRLQEALSTLTGVRSTIVNLYPGSENNVVWDPDAKEPSGAVIVTMEPGYILGADQAQAMRYLVGSSVGIAPENVTISDQNGNLLAAEGEGYDLAANVTQTVLQRLDLENTAEEDLEQKAAAIISMSYPDAADRSIVANVDLNFDDVVTETKEYLPMDDYIHGPIDYEEIAAVLGTGQYADGVVGETDNTDIPQYVDLNDDGEMDDVDFSRVRDYATSYVLEQITKNGPSIANASMTVAIADAGISDQARQNLREAVAQATGLALENVIVVGLVTPIPDEPVDPVDGTQLIPGIDNMFVLIAAAALLALILILVVVFILRGRAKKKRLAAEAAAAEAEREEAERIQREIEDRKNQLKNAALGDVNEDAITNEVKDFARNNPEITANLLRNWLKDEI